MYSDWSLTKIVTQGNIVGLGQSSSVGRATGTDNVDKLDDLRNELKHANEKISKLLDTVEDQEQLLKEKRNQLKRSSKKIVDLQRQVQSLGMIQAFFL